MRIPYSPVFLTQVREGNVKSISSKELAEWLSELGEDVVVGIEGSGSFGAGLCELLLAEGICVVEVERPRA